MLQKARSGDSAVFGNVTNQQHRNARTFGKLQQLSRTLTHLPHTAGSSLQLRIIHRLNTVDNQKLRLQGIRLRQNSIQIRCRKNQQIIIGLRSAKTDSTHCSLLLRFLAADIQHFDSLLPEAHACVQQNRRFADARRASQQHKAARNDTAAQHTVKFTDACCQTFYLSLGNAGDSAWPQFFIISRQIAFTCLGSYLCLLHQRVPAAAFRAASQPRGSNITAFLTNKSALSSGHAAAPFRCLRQQSVHLSPAAPAKTVLPQSPYENPFFYLQPRQ